MKYKIYESFKKYENHQNKNLNNATSILHYVNFKRC